MIEWGVDNWSYTLNLVPGVPASSRWSLTVLAVLLLCTGARRGRRLLDAPSQNPETGSIP